MYQIVIYVEETHKSNPNLVTFAWRFVEDMDAALSVVRHQSLIHMSMRYTLFAELELVA